MPYIITSVTNNGLFSFQKNAILKTKSWWQIKWSAIGIQKTNFHCTTDGCCKTSRPGQKINYNGTILIYSLPYQLLWVAGWINFLQLNWSSTRVKYITCFAAGAHQNIVGWLSSSINKPCVCDFDRVTHIQIEIK